MVLRARTVESLLLRLKESRPEKGRPFEIFKTAPTSVLFGRPRRGEREFARVFLSLSLPPPYR